MKSPSGSNASGTLRELASAAAVYVVVTIYFTWPLVTVAGDHLVTDWEVLVPDLYVLVWILASVARALVTDPAHLFDATAFHPIPKIIAHSEHLIGDQVLFGPLWAVTGNPVLAFNVLNFSSFVLAALFMHVLMKRWTGSTAAAYVAAFGFAFAPWRGALGRAHLLHVQYLPLVLLLLDRALLGGRVRAAVLAGAALGLQILCGYYIGYMAAVVIAAYFAATLIGFGIRDRGRAWAALGVMLATTCVLVLPVSVAYLERQAVGDLAQPPGFLSRYHTIVATEHMVLFLYVGLWTALLGATGMLVVPLRWPTDRLRAVRVLGLALCAAAGFAIARGPGGFADGWFAPYAWLSDLVPGFSRMRSPNRFGTVASLGLAGLAGFAIAEAIDRVRSVSAARLLTGAAAILGLLGTLAPVFSGPHPPLKAVPVAAGNDLPGVYRWLAANGRREPLLELPIGHDLGIRRDLVAAAAMYFSVYHRLPALNGHTSYPPPSYALIEAYGAQLPSAAPLALLARCAGVRWILVHEIPGRFQRSGWENLPGVHLRQVFRPAEVTTAFPVRRDVLYEISLPYDPSCTSKLFDSAVTLDGHRPVELGALHGALGIDGLAPVLNAGGETPVVVDMSNTGATAWSGPIADQRFQVNLRISWSDLGGEAPDAVQTQVILLPRDVPAGDRTSFEAWISHPRRPGRYRLTVRLAPANGLTPDGGLVWEREVKVGPRRLRTPPPTIGGTPESTRAMHTLWGAHPSSS